LRAFPHSPRLAAAPVQEEVGVLRVEPETWWIFAKYAGVRRMYEGGWLITKYPK
jgi:hypothetical protein